MDQKIGIEERTEAYKMLLSGSSHIEVAERFGISRQRVYQLFNGVAFPERRRKKSEPTLYPNVERWLIDNGSNVKALSTEIGIAGVTLWRQLRGVSPLKTSVAERISQITGMPIEVVMAKK